MSDIFDKLNIDLKNFKDEKKLHKELYDKICTEQSVLTRKYFEENLSSDFEKLSEIYKNYKKKLSVDFYKKNKELSIRLFDYFNSLNLSQSFWILLTYASKNSIMPLYLISFIDLAFKDILRIVCINSWINTSGLSLHKNIGLLL